MAGAEVVDGEPHPQLLERSQSLLGPGAISGDQPLGDLQRQRSRIDPVRRQGLADCRDEVRPELAPREVHRHAQLRRAGVRFLPHGQFPAGLVEHPSADRDDESRLLGKVNELQRAEQAPGRMFPAQQCLRAGEPVPIEAQNGLIDQPQLLILDRPAQLGREIETLAGFDVHLWFELLVA